MVLCLLNQGRDCPFKVAKFAWTRLVFYIYIEVDNVAIILKLLNLLQSSGACVEAGAGAGACVEAGAFVGAYIISRN